MSQTDVQMTHQRSLERFRQIFGERVHSLTEDGYQVRVSTDTPTLLFARLKHMSNGNEIILKGYPATLSITQRTNHVLKFIGVYGDEQPTTLHQP